MINSSPKMLENIKIAYDELLEELKEELSKIEDDAKRAKIERIKAQMSFETFEVCKYGETRTTAENKYKEALEKEDGIDVHYSEKIKELKLRINYLESDKDNIIKNR